MNEAIELVGGGWKGAIGRASSISIMRCEDEFRWTLFSIPRLQLGHAAAMLLFQGMTLQDFFPIDSFIRLSARPDTIIMSQGLHILLAGTPSKPGWVPVSLEGVRLGHITPVPPDLTRDRLLQTMLGRIL